MPATCPVLLRHIPSCPQWLPSCTLCWTARSTAGTAGAAGGRRRSGHSRHGGHGAARPAAAVQRAAVLAETAAMMANASVCCRLQLQCSTPPQRSQSPAVRSATAALPRAYGSGGAVAAPAPCLVLLPLLLPLLGRQLLTWQGSRPALAAPLGFRLWGEWSAGAAAAAAAQAQVQGRRPVAPEWTPQECTAQWLQARLQLRMTAATPATARAVGGVMGCGWLCVMAIRGGRPAMQQMSMHGVKRLLSLLGALRPASHDHAAMQAVKSHSGCLVGVTKQLIVVNLQTTSSTRGCSASGGSGGGGGAWLPTTLRTWTLAPWGPTGGLRVNR